MSETGYARYCEQQRIAKGDPLSGAFLKVKADREEKEGLSEFDGLIDVDRVEEPVFVNVEDEKIIEEMLTPITEDGEPLDFESFEDREEKKFNYDSEEEETFEDPEKRVKEEVGDAKVLVEDLDDSLSEIEGILD